MPEELSWFKVTRYPWYTSFIIYYNFKTHQLPEETTLVEDLPDDHKVKQYAVERGLLGNFPL